MIILLRLVFGGLLIAGLLCFAAFSFTGNRVWRQRGMRLVKWALIAALGFAAVVLLQLVIPRD